MFENDWILSSLSNPTLDIDDLVSIGGLNTKNTQFLKRSLIDFMKCKHPDGEIFRIMNFQLEQNQMPLIRQAIKLMPKLKKINLTQDQTIILIGFRLVQKVGELQVRELNLNRKQLNLRKYSIQKQESLKIILPKIMPYLIIQ